MKIFPFANSSCSTHYPHGYIVSKPTEQFVDWLTTVLPRSWWLDHNCSVEKLLNHRQLNPTMIEICLNNDAVLLLKLKWLVDS